MHEKEAVSKAGSEQAFDPWLQWTLFLGIVFVPLMLSAVTAEVAFERTKSLEFCSSCHDMSPYADDLKNPDSELLAAKHYQYRRINNNQCYTCHTDYNFLGPVNAKVRGMRHLLAYYLGPQKSPSLYKPFPNASCLQCHEGAKSFVKSGIHEPLMEQIRSNEMSCISCHGPVHPTHGEKIK